MLMIILQLCLILNINQFKKLKKLTFKQMLQRLSIAFAQVKTGNIFENVLNKIPQTICFLYRATAFT